METNPPELELVITFPEGVISSLAIPASWRQENENYLSRGSIDRFLPQDGTPGLSVMNTGMEVLPESDALFHKLLEENAVLSIPKPLEAKQIIELSDVFGFTTVGDNQYTNKAKHPDPQAPAFHLQSAMLISVNGKTVIEVKGHFVDYEGQPCNFYRGIFISNGPFRVLEILSESASKQEYEQFGPRFRHVVESIQWRA